MKIVIDCANGSGYKVAPKFFTDLGANVIVINNRPDGFNILENSGVFHLKPASELVVEEKADAGIVLDGDADRLIMIDEKGEVVDGDGILSIAAQDLKKNDSLNNNTVVTTVMANQGFIDLMKDNGIGVFVTPVGDKYVLDEMGKRGSSLGGEQCGHIIFSKFETTSDSILTAMEILSVMKREKKMLSELTKVFEKYPQKLVNVKVKEKVDFKKLTSVQKALSKAKQMIASKGRVLLRYSGTENIARIMVEAKSPAVVEGATKLIAEAIKKEIGR